MTLTESTVKFFVDKKPYEFKVIHNLIDMQGISFNDALDSWLFRTKRYTAESLCQYIKLKVESAIALTEDQYKRLNQQ
ncbi:MAG TPA: hypothetical protein VF622_04700 [Segetibacter sp.]|jgi:hypothetical protein